MSVMMSNMNMSEQGGFVLQQQPIKSGSGSKLECNEECAQLERNSRLALALQIENPGDIASRLAPPAYSEAVLTLAKKDLTFAKGVHDRLVDLVRLAKESQLRKSRSYSFEVMNREKRAFVHELASHFGCESEAVDAEPNRNVIVTAYRDRIFMPSLSVVDVVTKQRKAPGPSNPMRTVSSAPSLNMRSLNPNPWNGTNAAVIKKQKSPEEEKVVDPFDD